MAVLKHHGWSKVEDVQEAMFIAERDGHRLVLCLYVDDLLAAGMEAPLRAALDELRAPSGASRQELGNHFFMEPAEPASHYLGIDLEGPVTDAAGRHFYLQQEAYCQHVVRPLLQRVGLHGRVAPLPEAGR